VSEDHSQRLDRVESEVGTIRTEMGGLKDNLGRVQADVKGLGAILSRIEQGVVRAQEQQDQREAQSKHSPIAIATVLITIMSMLVGGAWLISGSMAKMDERSVWMQREQDRVWALLHKGGSRDEPGQTDQ
jgi:hypothetical protein